MEAVVTPQELSALERIARREAHARAQRDYQTHAAELLKLVSRMHAEGRSAGEIEAAILRGYRSMHGTQRSALTHEDGHGHGE